MELNHFDGRGQNTNLQEARQSLYRPVQEVGLNININHTILKMGVKANGETTCVNSYQLGGF